MRSMAEGNSAEMQLEAWRNFIVNTKGNIGWKAVADNGELVGIKRPVHLGTNDHLSTLYLLGAGGPIGTGERTLQSGGYLPNQEGHSGTGGQEKWVLGEGVTSAAGMMRPFDAMREITGTLMIMLFDGPRPLARQAARATGMEAPRTWRGWPKHLMTVIAAADGCRCGGAGRLGCICRRKPPRWTTFGRRPLAAELGEAPTEMAASSGATSWSTPQKKPLAVKQHPAEIVDVAVSTVGHNPMEANSSIRMAATEFVGNSACLGRRVPSQRWGKVLALHSAKGKLGGRLRGLGRRAPRR